MKTRDQFERERESVCACVRERMHSLPWERVRELNILYFICLFVFFLVLFSLRFFYVNHCKLLEETSHCTICYVLYLYKLYERKNDERLAARIELLRLLSFGVPRRKVTRKRDFI